MLSFLRPPSSDYCFYKKKKREEKLTRRINLFFQFFFFKMRYLNSGFEEKLLSKLCNGRITYELDGDFKVLVILQV